MNHQRLASGPQFPPLESGVLCYNRAAAGTNVQRGRPSWKLRPSDFTCQAQCRASVFVILWNESRRSWVSPGTLRIYPMDASKCMQSAALPSLTRSVANCAAARAWPVWRKSPKATLKYESSFRTDSASSATIELLGAEHAE